LIEVMVAARVEEAEGIVALDLVACGGAALPRFEAGAHVEVQVGPGLIRQYSLCNDPAETGRYRLAVLLEPESRGGSAGIHRGFAVGARAQISTPRNNFALVEDAPQSVLLGGGIGITPLMAMARRLHALGRPFALHYCTRSRARAAFLDELAAARFAPQVAIYHDDAPEAGRFAVGAALPPPASGAHLYVCGPQGFMDNVIAAARAAGWDEARIHREYFSAAVDGSGDGFTVRADRSGIEVEVAAGQTIADALIDQGVHVPLSCTEGVCGFCLTPVLEGEPDHRDLYQSDREKAANTQIAVCCSRAKSRLLVLDI